MVELSHHICHAVHAQCPRDQLIHSLGPFGFFAEQTRGLLLARYHIMIGECRIRMSTMLGKMLVIYVDPMKRLQNSSTTWSQTLA